MTRRQLSQLRESQFEYFGSSELSQQPSIDKAALINQQKPTDMNNESSQLTGEEIAKVFCWYADAPLLINGVRTDHVFLGTTPHRQNPVVYSQSNGSEWVDWEAVKLILSPLASITDEDAIEIAKIAGNYNNDPSTGKALLNEYLRSSRCNVHGSEWWEIFQYLISKGYAVPLFFSPGHWANGKDAISLGIAIDKNSTQNT